jgi:uncharacterized protein DUF998
VSVVGAVAGYAGAVLYCSFLLAGVLGSRLSAVDSLASELEVPGQPGSGLLRLTGTVSGLVIPVFAAALWYRLPRDRPAALGCLFLAVAGACAVLDARYPMPCTPSTDRSCRRRVEQVSLLAQVHHPHAMSGSVGIFAVVMAMLWLGRARGVRAWSSWLAAASLVCAVLLSAAGLLELALLYSGHGAGLVERGYLLLVAAWLAALAGYLLRDGLAGARRLSTVDGTVSRRRR